MKSINVPIMSVRVLTILLSLCMFAGLNSLGAHVHWETHGHEAEHGHVISALDLDHAKAHADGSIDDESAKMGTRVAPDLPQMGPAPVAVVVVSEHVPTRLPLQAEQHVTGPPRYLTPPSQAPPRTSLIV